MPDEIFTVVTADNTRNTMQLAVLALLLTTLVVVVNEITQP